MNTEDDGEANWRRGAQLGVYLAVLWLVFELTTGRSHHSYNARMAQLSVLSVCKNFVQCIFTGGLLGQLRALRSYAKSIAIGCLVGLMASSISFDLMQVVWGTIWGGGIGGCCCLLERNESKNPFAG